VVEEPETAGVSSGAGAAVPAVAAAFGADLSLPVPRPSSDTTVEHVEDDWDSLSHGRSRAASATAPAVPQTYVLATFDYTAQRPIELSFATNGMFNHILAVWC
jgi:hypothetical protein